MLMALENVAVWPAAIVCDVVPALAMEKSGTAATVSVRFAEEAE